MNWREKIEAQIAALEDYATGMSAATSDYYAKSLRQLLDVAVAAEQVHNNPFTGKGYWLELTEALDKLREVGDE